MRVTVLGAIALVASGVAVAIAIVQSLSSSSAQSQNRPRYLPEYTASGDLILPKDFHEWVYVGSPLTPNALNGGMAGFPEFHNVYIEPGSYEIYKKTNVFPEGTIFFKELQLTLPPAENPDGSRTEPSGRGYFPGPWNGADVTVTVLSTMVAVAAYGQKDAASNNASKADSVVDANGNLHVPDAYRTTYQFLGSWAVADDQGKIVWTVLAQRRNYETRVIAEAA